MFRHFITRLPRLRAPFTSLSDTASLNSKVCTLRTIALNYSAAGADVRSFGSVGRLSCSAGCETLEFSDAVSDNEVKGARRRGDRGYEVANISKSILLAAVAACLWVSACGGGNQANQVVVQVSPAGGTLVVKQDVTLTAIVTGATDVSATFDCSFTTTPNATTADPNPKA